MCGIAGYFRGGGLSVADLAARLPAMAAAQCHRGPDQQGFAVFADAAPRFAATAADIAAPAAAGALGGFAHQRLSILDLSAAGRQPMASADGRHWLCLNGEVYNYLELRAPLVAAGARFRSSSDTAVLLQLLAGRGPACLQACNGMWAFAWWDAQTRTLTLARDRFGVKPLYLWQSGDRLAFASEIKALLALPEVPRQPDERAVADYLVHGRVDCFDFTFFSGITCLPPGHLARVTFAGGGAPAVAVEPWWSLADAVAAEQDRTRSLSFAAAAAHLRECLTDAVRLRLRSDVPVGTCLSGGLDSSAVACLATPHLTPGNQNAFSACYRDFARDETPWMDMVVQQTRLRWHPVYPAAAELAADLPRLLHHQEQPFSSTSIYAQWRVFELARREGIIVTLDGQGADETLAGYDYFFPVYYAQLLRALHVGEWLAESRGRAARQHGSWLRELASTAGGFCGHRRMTRLAGLVSPQYRSDWVAPRLRRLARDLVQPPPLPRGEYLNRRLGEVFAASGLPALLRYADRNAMAHGVESRMPFMDWRVVALLLALPASYKLRAGESKAVLREALRGVIPEPIRERQDKIGFETPEAAWFRTALQPGMAAFMRAPALAELPWFAAARLRGLWEHHTAGTLNASRPLWRAWCLAQWAEQVCEGLPWSHGRVAQFCLR